MVNVLTNAILNKIRSALLKMLFPLFVWIGDKHMPFTRKKITGKHYYALRDQITPGSIILTRTQGELTTILIPGYWTHAAIYVGIVDGVETVVEAVGSGVRKVDLVSFLTSKDDIAVMVPCFCGNDVMQLAAKSCLAQVGKDYDYEFDWEMGNQKAFYCAELPYWGYLQNLHDMPFELKDTLGEPTIKPDDYYLAEDYWALVYGPFLKKVEIK